MSNMVLWSNLHSMWAAAGSNAVTAAVGGSEQSIYTETFVDYSVLQI